MDYKSVVDRMSKSKSQDKGKMSEVDEQILKIFDIKKVSMRIPNRISVCVTRQ